MSVEDSWNRIVTWCTANAPRTGSAVTPAASSADLAATEARFPRPWPADLRAWYGLHNGTTTHSGPLFGTVISCWELLSLDGIVESQQMYLDIYDGAADEFGADADAAGESAGTWLPEYVPIGSDGTGCALFVDTRPGPQSGCVTGFMREDADFDGPSWPSVEAMLADVADALESGRPCADGWAPSVEDGALDWQPA